MAEPLWTADEIAAAVGGKASRGVRATGVSIDTRTIEPGDLFVALGGVRDGHEFVARPWPRARPGPGRAPVGEAGGDGRRRRLPALEDARRAARERAPQARRGAVTGSVGKTSVTQAVMAGLMLAGPAHASVKSYNNHIGVPLTLARMPRDTERAVFEVGMNHADEITPLSRMVRPYAAVITTVGPVHTENFPTARPASPRPRPRSSTACCRRRRRAQRRQPLVRPAEDRRARRGARSAASARARTATPA
jgi:UDP-N-acetylmuramoyl-tripeptide--D-alanyl-D-alanine ligase